MIVSWSCEPNRYLTWFVVADGAELLQRRYNEVDQQFEYYVHYANLNRRLDEWVTRQRYGS